MNRASSLSVASLLVCPALLFAAADPPGWAEPFQKAPPGWAEAFQRANRLLATGNFEGSLAGLTSALEAAKASGEYPFQTGLTLLQIGFVDFQLGRFRDAERFYLAALALSNRPQDAPNFDRSIALTGLGSVYLKTGELDKAERFARGALRIKEEALGPESIDLSGPLQNLAAIYQAEHRSRDAKDLFSRAIAVAEQAGGDHRGIAAARGNLAMLLAAEGDLASAIREAEKAASIWKASANWDEPQLAAALNGLASIYCQAKRWRDAEQPILRAREIMVRTFGDRHPALEPILRTYASVLTHTGHKREAKQMTRSADEIARESFSKNLIGYTVDARSYR